MELEELTTAKQEKLLRQPEEAGWLSLSAAPLRSRICQGAVPSRGIRYAFPCLSRELLGLAGWLAKPCRVTAEGPKQRAPFWGQNGSWQPPRLGALPQHSSEARRQAHVPELTLNAFKTCRLSSLSAPILVSRPTERRAHLCRSTGLLLTEIPVTTRNKQLISFLLCHMQYHKGTPCSFHLPVAIDREGLCGFWCEITAEHTNASYHEAEAVACEERHWVYGG